MLDNFRETAITWDKANRKVYEPLRVSAGDNKGRKLSIQVVNGGVVENLSGASLSLFWETRDKMHKGLDVFTAVDATKGEFEIYYTTGMLSNEGVLKANLVLVDTSGRVVSEPFTITVFKGIDDDAIQSSDSFTALTEALIDVSNLEQNYAPRLNDLTAQLQQTEQNLSSQLAQKVSKGNVSVGDINKNLGKLDQTYMTDEFIQQMAGDTPVNAVPEDLSLVDDKYAFKSVRPEKLSFIPLQGSKGKNLFDKSAVTLNFYVSQSSGKLVAAEGFTASDWVPIEPDTYYTLQSNPQSAFYTENKEYISGTATEKTILSPPNAKYIRISTQVVHLDAQQLEKGQDSTFYQAFGNRLNPMSIDEKSIEDKHLKDKYAPVSVGKNLFDKSTAIAGYYVKFDNGILAVSAEYSASDWIEIESSTLYTMTHSQQVAFYSSEKVYISGQSEGTTFTTPANAKYVRVTTETGKLDTQQLEKGPATSYEPFGYYIKEGYHIGDGGEVTKIIVAPTGGDFTKVSDALASIKDASINKPYRILVKNGTYIDTFRTKHHVDIIGEDKYKTVIEYTGDYSDYVNTSTIFGETTSVIENLTVVAYDTKYPLHSDAATGAYRMIVRNCVFIHNGFSGAGAGTPFGIGLYENQNIEMYDCELIGDGKTGNAGVFFHNMGSSEFSGEGYRSLRVENSKISNVSYGFRVNGISTTLNQKNDAFLINNDIQADNAEIFIDASVDLSWNVVSRGNTLSRVSRNNNNNYIVEQPGFTKRYKNTGIPILLGEVVLLNGTTNTVTASNAANSPQVVGVALQDIPTGSTGVVQVRGYVSQCKVGGATSIANNDLISSTADRGGGRSDIRPFAIAKGAFTGGEVDKFIPVILLPMIS